MDQNPDNRPISARRLQRMAAVLARRQPDVTIILEDVHDPHNVSAVLRSCDATGVSNVRLVYDLDEPPELSRGVAAGTHNWLNVDQDRSIADSYEIVRGRGQRVLATTLLGSTHDLYDLDLTDPVALVFGNESRGLSQDAIRGADDRIRIPMMGMAESLNISVACAVTLFELMRQRRDAGQFDCAATPLEDMRWTLEQWLRRDRRDPRIASAADFDPTVYPVVRPRTHPIPTNNDGAD